MLYLKTFQVRSRKELPKKIQLKYYKIWQNKYLTAGDEGDGAEDEDGEDRVNVRQGG